MIVYSNGDSLGIYGDTDLRYPEFVTKILNADRLVNNGRDASCNRRIIRSTLRDCIELRQNHPTEQIVCLVALGSMIRNEWWNLDITPKDNDGHFESFQIHGSSLNRSYPAYRYTQEWFKHYDTEAETTNLYTDIIMLTTWLRYNNIQYLLFSGNTYTYKEIDYNSPFIKSLYNELHKDPAVLKLTQFSIADECWNAGHRPFDTTEIHGHWTEPAHKFFAERIVEIYNSVYNLKDQT